MADFRRYTAQALREETLDRVIQLAYGEYAEHPIDRPDWLGHLAYDEMERRQSPCLRCGNLYDHRYPCVS